MKPMQKMKALRTAFALATLLAMSGGAWAKPSNVGPGIPGDLTPTRDSVDLAVPVAGFPSCDINNLTQTYSVKAYIFQPSGRLFAVGIGFSGTFTCSTDPNTTQDVFMTVDAVQGLTFKPGPATLIYQVLRTDSSAQTVITVDEKGSRVDLH